ncbi:MAG: hypothetical protein FK730_00680 [Asgard group archaeon]|nr:hypothetical protein [Asgard group archaeon]
MKPLDNKFVLSNGVLWLYLKQNEAHLFSLGNWLLSYTLPERYSLEKIIHIEDIGNRAYFTYEDDLSREIFIENNQLKDKFNEEFNLEIIPALSNSLIFRGDEDLPEISTPIVHLNNNTFTRKGYPTIQYSKQKKEVLINCNFLNKSVDASYFKHLTDPDSIVHPYCRFNDKNLTKLFQDSLRSLYKLRMQTPDGEIKAAGFPDFPSLFGRDFALSALGEIYIWPINIHEEVFVHLKHIGKKINVIRNEAPGRAIHEFNYDIETMSDKYQYFPSWYANDSNSLLLLTMFRLARIQNIKSIIENNTTIISSLFQHIITLDLDQDGFIEYKKHPSQLLIHQTWRDGGDEIRHPDDEIVTHPIAPLHDQLCFYGALKEIENYMLANKETKIASKIEINYIQDLILKLKNEINDKFWMPKLGSYALALDGNNEQVKVVNSDVCLGYYFNVFDKDKARQQYKAMIDTKRLFDIVGLRTVSKEHPLYSPKKYQRGGVWPWQLALTIAGVRNYNFDIVPFINCLRNISQEGSIAEVYIPDNPKPVPLTSCIEQRWSSAIPWLALVEGLLGLSFDYNEKIDFEPKTKGIDLLPLHIEGFQFYSQKHNITIFEDGQGELKRITKRGIEKIMLI